MGEITNSTAHRRSEKHVLPMFALQMPMGLVLGWIMGKASVLILNRFELEYDGLYPVLSRSLVLLTYGLNDVLGGSGFLAIYVVELVMGNRQFVHKRSLMRFHDGLAWLMQITMFLALGLQVFPSKIIPIIGIGLLVSLFLMFFARPLSVFLTLAFYQNVHEGESIYLMGRPARSGPHYPWDFSGARSGAAGRNDLQCCFFHRRDVGASPGDIVAHHGALAHDALRRELADARARSR